MRSSLIQHEYRESMAKGCFLVKYLYWRWASRRDRLHPKNYYSSFDQRAKTIFSNLYFVFVKDRNNSSERLTHYFWNALNPSRRMFCHIIVFNSCGWAAKAKMAESFKWHLLQLQIMLIPCMMIMEDKTASARWQPAFSWFSSANTYCVNKNVFTLGRAKL